MNYNLYSSKTVRRLIPWVTRKPVMLAWMDLLLSPIEKVNQDFQAFLAEKRIEASLNSQTQLMEEYLNNKFKGFFQSSEERIYIIHSTSSGVAVYFEFEDELEQVVLYNNVNEPGYTDTVTYLDGENSTGLPFDFRVQLPLSFQGNRTIVGQIEAIINKYKISPFKYDITYI